MLVVRCSSSELRRAAAVAHARRPDSPARSRSSRIRPIARCSSSCSRTATSASCATAPCSAPTSSICRRRSSRGGEQGLLGLAFPPDDGHERPLLRRTSPIARATPSSRASAGRATAVVADPASRFDLRWGGAAGRRSSRSRSRITTAATSCSAPTDFSTSASATAARATIRIIARRTRTELLGKMLRIDVSVPDAHPPAIRSRPAIRSSTAAPSRRGRRSGRSACATRGATASTIRRAAAPARWSSATSARTASKRSTTSRRGRGGRNYGWRNREGAARQRHVAAAGVPAAGRSDLRVRPLGRPVDHRRLRLSRRGAAGDVSRPLLLRRFRRRAASGRSR